MAVNAIADLRHSKDGLSVQIRAEAVFLSHPQIQNRPL
jgi:hypothetical protein